MKAYYRYTKISPDGNEVLYELNIHYQSFLIALYFIGTHLPSKRLAEKRPLDYFRIIRDDALGICISPSEIVGENFRWGVLIENPNISLLKSLVERSRLSASGIRIKEKISPQDIISEFLKSL